MMMKVSLLTLAAVLATTTAFTVNPHVVQRSHGSVLGMTAENNNSNEQQQHAAAGFARFFGVLTAASVLAFHPLPASAANNLVDMPVSPFSTLQLADTTKMMDMSLPTYDDVKSAKASAANVDSLTIAPVKKKEAPKRGKSFSSAILNKESTASDDKKKAQKQKGPNAFTKALLPSLSKEGPPVQREEAAVAPVAAAAARYVPAAPAPAPMAPVPAAPENVETVKYDF